MSRRLLTWHPSVLLPLLAATAALAGVRSENLSESEQWVLNQLTAKKAADFASADAPTETMIRGEFLTQLITDWIDEKHDTTNGIRILNAKVIGVFVIPTHDPVTFPMAFEKCRFLDGVNGAGLRSTSQVSFTGSAFGEANFSRMDVAESALFGNCTFRKDANFERVHAKVLWFQDSRFLNPEANATFSHIKILESVGFTGVRVAGWFWLYRAKVGRELFLNEGQFTRADGTLQCNEVEAKFIRLDGSIFHGGAVFWNSKVSGWFRAVGVEFLSPNLLFSCRGMNVSGGFVLDNSSFRGGATLDQVVIDGDLSVRNVTFGPQPNGIDGIVTLRVQVAGSACFEGVTFDVKKVTLSNSTIGSLCWCDVEWPEDSTLVDLSGLTLEGLRDMRSTHGTTWWRELLGLANRATYENSFYSQLESNLHSLGNIDGATQVFLAARNRQRQEILTGWPRVGSWLYRCGSNYGKNPFLPLTWLGLLWLTGCLVFRDRMEICDKPPKAARYNAKAARYNVLLYSIERMSLKPIDQVRWWRPTGRIRQSYAWGHATVATLLGLALLAALADRLGLPLKF